VIAEPPSDAGALQSSATLPLAGVADVSVGAPGTFAVDVAESTVTSSGAESGDVLPATSDALTAIVYEPGASVGNLNRHSPDVSGAAVPAGAPLLTTLIVPAPPATVPVTVGVVPVVALAQIGAVPDPVSRHGAGGVGGGVPSTATVARPDAGDLFPAESEATALRLYTPSASGVDVTDHDPETSESAPPTPTVLLSSWIEFFPSDVPMKEMLRYMVTLSPRTPESLYDAIAGVDGIDGAIVSTEK